MCGTHRDTGNRLINILYAAVILDVALILIREFNKAVKNSVRCYYAYCAVSCLGYHVAKILQFFESTHLGIPFDDSLQDSLCLDESVSARNTLTAGLVNGHLKYRTIHNERTHSRRIRCHT